MNENEIIKLLMQQIADLKAENADLRGILKAFASKETNVVVNSYNGSQATAEHKEDHKEKISNIKHDGGIINNSHEMTNSNSY